MIKRLISALSTLAVIAVLALTALLVGARFIGLTPYSVLSGSMEPAYSVGDLLYVRKIPAEDIETGMPITFVANEHLVIVTHRVVEVNIRTSTQEPIIDENGKAAMGRDGKPIMQEIPLDEPVCYFRTRGDANPIDDATLVHENNVIGVPVYSIPYIGYFVTMLQTTAGKVMAGCFGMVIVLLMFLPEMLQAVGRCEKEKEEEQSHSEEDEQTPGEDTLICEEKTGDDVVVDEKNAPQGDDVLRTAKDAPQGDDIVIEAAENADRK
ncbi:MAG: signal peptidase I [Clostridia bacterium]|nr:signal peptidase I [Clostridia bacterium]